MPSIRNAVVEKQQKYKLNVEKNMYFYFTCVHL